MLVENLIVCNNITRNTNPTISDPIYFTISGNQVLYDPNCVDPDNDSLSYNLGVSYDTSSYTPANVNVNSVTGQLSFSKDSIGKYSFIIEVSEWKKNSAGKFYICGQSKIDFVMNINASVGIAESKKEFEGISISPNPFTNQLFIHSENKTLILKHLEIFNYLGQKVGDYKNWPVNSSLHLDVPKGIYFLSVDGTKTYKIIKE